MKVRDGPAFVRRNAVAWVYLLSAGLLEVVWALALKQSSGFTRLIPSIVTVVAALASFVLLSLAMKSMPLGSAYTIWTGIGAIGAFAVGVIVLGEQANVSRVAAAALIVAGLVMMKLSTPAT